MTGFSADWLALRVAADARARDKDLAARLGAYFAGRAQVRVLDLGAGTGTNLRATAPLMGASQQWVLADNDPALLAHAKPFAKITIERCVADLSGDLSGLFNPAPDLVTASAFFDLCGANWIDRLMSMVSGCGAAFYTVLTYDGREEWLPPHSLDNEVRTAFHADQRRDKGLGPALGPGAHAHLVERLRELGYQVADSSSDWVLRQPGDGALIAALAEGSAASVAGIIGTKQAEIWRAARTGARSVTVGHRDLLALPSG